MIPFGLQRDSISVSVILNSLCQRIKMCPTAKLFVRISHFTCQRFNNESSSSLRDSYEIDVICEVILMKMWYRDFSEISHIPFSSYLLVVCSSDSSVYPVIHAFLRCQRNLAFKHEASGSASKDPVRSLCWHKLALGESFAKSPENRLSFVDAAFHIKVCVNIFLSGFMWPMMWGYAVHSGVDWKGFQSAPSGKCCVY